ncbi:MAG: hypothetical protein U9Q30_04050 [Campylobacterota bacterium]|nr:hypothetical protein [Campylobacterota bacterium]
MLKKTKYLFIIILLNMSLFLFMFIILFNNQVDTKKDKELFISIVGLPDLAISTTDSYIRHRSLTNMKTIFKDGPEHIEYSKVSFTINHTGK